MLSPLSSLGQCRVARYEPICKWRGTDPTLLVLEVYQGLCVMGFGQSLMVTGKVDGWLSSNKGEGAMKTEHCSVHTGAVCINRVSQITAEKRECTQLLSSVRCPRKQKQYTCGIAEVTSRVEQEWTPWFMRISCHKNESKNIHPCPVLPSQE